MRFMYILFEGLTSLKMSPICLHGFAGKNVAAMNDHFTNDFVDEKGVTTTSCQMMIFI